MHKHWRRNSLTSWLQRDAGPGRFRVGALCILDEDWDAAFGEADSLHRRGGPFAEVISAEHAEDKGRW